MKLIFVIVVLFILLLYVMYINSFNDSVAIESNVAKSETPSSLKQLSISTRLINDKERVDKPIGIK